MSSLKCLMSLSFVCSTTGFRATLTSMEIYRYGSSHLSYNVPGRAQISTTSSAWVGIRRARRRPQGMCMTAEAGEQQGEEREVAPRLKRVRKRRKDQGSIAEMEEQEEVSEVTSVLPRSVDVDAMSASGTGTTTSSVDRQSAETPVAQDGEEGATTGILDPVPQPIRTGTKGTKVRIGDDSYDGVNDKLTDAASAASGAVGSAASVVSGAAKSAMKTALSVLGDGESSDARGEQGTKIVPQPRKSLRDLTELGEDIARYKERESLIRQGRGDDEGSFALGAKDLISTIITVDFFVVIAFMLWFIAGVVSTYILQDTFLLDKFNDSWSSIVQPALGVLMGGTIAGGVVSKLRDSNGDDKNTR